MAEQENGREFLPGFPTVDQFTQERRGLQKLPIVTYRIYYLTQCCGPEKCYFGYGSKILPMWIRILPTVPIPTTRTYV